MTIPDFESLLRTLLASVPHVDLATLATHAIPPASDNAAWAAAKAVEDRMAPLQAGRLDGMAMDRFYFPQGIAGPLVPALHGHETAMVEGKRET